MIPHELLVPSIKRGRQDALHGLPQSFIVPRPYRLGGELTVPIRRFMLGAYVIALPDRELVGMPHVSLVFDLAVRRDVDQLFIAVVQS